VITFSSECEAVGTTGRAVIPALLHTIFTFTWSHEWPRAHQRPSPCLDVSWIHFIRSGTDRISLLILCFFLLGRCSSKSLRLRRFKSDLNEICRNCSSSSAYRLTELDFWYDVVLSRWPLWCPPAARCCIWRSVRRLPLARRARVTSLARCTRYSSWSIVHSYLCFFSFQITSVPNNVLYKINWHLTCLLNCSALRQPAGKGVKTVGSTLCLKKGPRHYRLLL